MWVDDPVVFTLRFSKTPKWNLMSHGRRFKEMNQLCSHELYIYIYIHNL